MAAVIFLAVLIRIAILYFLAPYVLTSVLNSFGFDITFWQSLLSLWLIYLITSLMKRGNN